MNDVIYIDTRIGSLSLFAPPEAVDDYVLWLHEKYKRCTGKDGQQTIYYGVSQKINAIIQQPKNNQSSVITFGPYAGPAAMVIEEIARGSIQVEILA